MGYLDQFSQIEALSSSLSSPTSSINYLALILVACRPQADGQTEHVNQELEGFSQANTRTIGMSCYY
jgi:hypothetical protein